MLKIAICDDILTIAQDMKEKICKHTFEEELEVDTFTSGSTLYEETVKKRYEIIFLDIELEPEKGKAGMNGMELSNKIKNLYPDVVIIFFTGNEGYEMELLNFEPFRFINKPVMEWELIKVINSAIQRVKNWEERFFTYSHNKAKFQVNINKIIYFSSDSPRIDIRSIDGIMTFRGKMDDVEKDVMELTEDFYRVSKSYLVNRNYVKKYTSKEITLETGEKIPVSRRYMKNLITRMLEETEI